MTDTLAVLGLLALLTSGELDRTVSYVVLVAMALALALPERFQDRPTFRKAAVAAPLVLLGVQVLRLASGESLLAASIEFAAGLQVLRLATRRGAAHDQQVIVLALLHLIAGTVLGSGLTYGLCFLGFLIVTPGALVLSHLRREVEGNYRQGARDRTGLPVDVPRILRSRRVIGRQFLVLTCLLSVPIFLFTAVIFVLFPRVGLSLLLLNHNHPDRMVGFSEHVDLGGVGRLRSDPTIVMRVDPPPLPGPPGAPPPPRLALYLRGAAFDRYDGRAWSRTHHDEVPADQIGTDVKLRRFPDPVHDRMMHIDLEPIDPPVVFVPLEAVALSVLAPTPGLDQSRPELFLGGEGVLRYNSLAQRGLRYNVSLAGNLEPPVPQLTAGERARYLALPPLPPRIAELAETWTLGATSTREQAHLIEAALRGGYRYDLDSPSGAAPNPLEDFLFRSKRGHCEFYSTAMTVLLRELGVPARNVTGFVGGTYNRFSRSYVVRQGDAHSWVEVWLDNAGWTRFDPTPPSDAAPRSELTGVLAVMRDFVEALGQRWSRHVVGYDLSQQIGIYDQLRESYLHVIPRHGVAGRLFASPKKLLLGVLALVGLAIGVQRLLRRRQQPNKDHQRTDEERGAHEAAALYRALEKLLAARGVPRPASTPPLAHARTLESLGHPLGAETVELTERYLRVRFGGEALDHTSRRAYLERLQLMRSIPVEPRERPPSAAAGHAP
jgi:transglutaminase-like putative cysteine protease